MTDQTPRDPGRSGSDDPIEVFVDPELEDLVPIFLENRRKDVGRLREALKGGDWETVEDLGHSMKGMGGAYGFEPISEIGAELERLAAADEIDEVDIRAVRSRVDELERYLARVEVRVAEE